MFCIIRCTIEESTRENRKSGRLKNLKLIAVREKWSDHQGVRRYMMYDTKLDDVYITYI